MTVEFILLGSFLTFINSLILFAIQRWFKITDEKNKEIQENFRNLCRKIDVLLQQNNNIINAITFIVAEHTKNHGNNPYLEHLLDNLEKRN
jgi:hypothetical protein